jgi:P4 family phage/plasmid primase-like protien
VNAHTDLKSAGTLSSESVAADINAAVDFLKQWHETVGGFPVLSAARTHPETGAKGKFETRSFPTKDWDAVNRWIADHQSDRVDRDGPMWSNIYFSVNTPKAELNSKMALRDVGSLVALHVDTDIRTTETQPQGMARIIKTFEGYKRPPSVIVASGGGAQAFWFLKEPTAVNGDLAIAEDLKLYNKALERDLAGDHCHSIEHIMRVPFTVNLPNEAKRKKGRVPALARLHLFDASRRYSLDDFEKALTDKPPEQAGFTPLGDYEPIGDDDPTLEELGPEELALGQQGDPERKYGGDRSRAAFAFATACKRAGVTDDALARVIMDPAWRIGDCIRDKGNETKRHLRRLVERARTFVDQDLDKPPIVSRNDWARNRDVFHLRVAPYLIYWNGSFYDYAEEDACYHDLEEMAVESMVGRFLHSALVFSKNEESKKLILVPFRPRNKDHAELVKELKRDGYQDREKLAPPCWINGASGPPPRECIALLNGILHVPTREMRGSTPDYFTVNALAFNYDREATCPLWLDTIAQWWPRVDGEPSAEEMLLQEVFGYLLTAWTSLQKIFIILGPGRSGKGTIMRVLRMLLGERNVAAPNVQGLVDTFGRSPLIGKLAALISEAVFGDRGDRTNFTRILKEISGEDKVSVNRKNKDEWEGQLCSRIVIASNKMLRFEDDSDAFMNRLVPLRMSVSFAGKEDPQLTEKLSAELPGILNWSLVGYDRLRKNECFTETKAGRDIAVEVSRAASPAKTFVQDHCVVEADAQVTEREFYKAYSTWCANNGLVPDRLGDVLDAVLAGNINVSKFRDTRCCAGCPHPGTCAHDSKCVGKGTVGKKGKIDRPRCLSGIRLRPEADEIPF